MKYSILIASLFISCAFAIELADRCMEDSSCKAENSECRRDAASTCVYGTCSCKSGFGVQASECWKVNGLDESCKVADKAICDVDKHLTCTAQECKCATGFTDRGVCEPVAKDYDTACDHTLQCTAGGETNVICSGGPPTKCICAPGFYRNGNKCDPKLEFDADCSGANAGNCNNVKGLDCINDKCKCISTLFEKNGACVEGSKGDDCNAVAPFKTCQSSINLECRDGKCNCTANLEEKTFYLAGVEVTQCVHSDAKFDIPYLDKCDETTTTDAGRFCAVNLKCETCYPGSSDKICLNKNLPVTVPPTQQTTKGSATTVTTTFSSVAISLISFAMVGLRV